MDELQDRRDQLTGQHITSLSQCSSRAGSRSGLVIAPLPALFRPGVVGRQTAEYRLELVLERAQLGPLLVGASTSRTSDPLLRRSFRAAGYLGLLGLACIWVDCEP